MEWEKIKKDDSTSKVCKVKGKGREGKGRKDKAEDKTLLLGISFQGKKGFGMKISNPFFV